MKFINVLRSHGNEFVDEKDYIVEIIKIYNKEETKRKEVSIGMTKDGMLTLMKAIADVLGEDTEKGEGITIYQDGSSPNYD